MLAKKLHRQREERYLKLSWTMGNPSMRNENRPKQVFLGYLSRNADDNPWLGTVKCLEIRDLLLNIAVQNCTLSFWELLLIQINISMKCIFKKALTFTVLKCDKLNRSIQLYILYMWKFIYVKSHAFEISSKIQTSTGVM